MLKAAIDAPFRGLIKISTEVSAAMSRGHPVVALESTIISHGDSDFLLPFQLFDCSGFWFFVEVFETLEPLLSKPKKHKHFNLITVSWIIWYSLDTNGTFVEHVSNAC